MVPYFILLFTVTIFVYGGRRAGRQVQAVSLLVVSLLLVLFAGLRDRLVGTDTGNYIYIYSKVNTFDDMFRTSEIGFNALMLFSKLFSNEYASLLIVIAIIVVICYVTTIVKLTRRYETGIFLWVVLGGYTFFFNGARQGIAAAICFYALPWLLKRKPRQYFMCIFLAFLFHHTALLAVVFYFIASPKVNRRQLVNVFFGVVIMVLFLSVFVDIAAALIDDKYAVYGEKSDGGGRLTVAFLLFQGALLYIAKSTVVDSHIYYSRLLNIYLIGLIPAIASTLASVNPSGVLRLSIYFSSTAILLWPMVFNSMDLKRYRHISAYIFCLFSLVYFYMTTEKFSNLSPYQINLGIF